MLIGSRGISIASASWIMVDLMVDQHFVGQLSSYCALDQSRDLSRRGIHLSKTGPLQLSKRIPIRNRYRLHEHRSSNLGNR